MPKGSQIKKMVTPVVKGQAVAHLCQTYAVMSQRWWLMFRSREMRVGRELDAVISPRGRPQSVVSDNGVESRQDTGVDCVRLNFGGSFVS